MTYLEKALEMHPELTEDDLINNNCPDFIFCIPLFTCPRNEPPCRVCWEQEYKGEEVR